MKSPLIFRIFKDDQLVAVKQFDQDQIVFGHGGQTDIDLDSESVSPIHCLIELRDAGFYICDLGSKGGTFKGGRAVLDEIIESGDEFVVGPFRVLFSVGAPKPKVPPIGIQSGDKADSSDKTEFPENLKGVATDSSKMPPPSVTKSEVLNVVPFVAPKSNKADEKVQRSEGKSRPEIKAAKPSKDKSKSKKTFAPASDITDLRGYLKPGKGAGVEVIVAWKERVLETYHFKGQQLVRVNGFSGNCIALPDGLVPRAFPLIEISGGFKVNATSDMEVELISSQGIRKVEELLQSGRALKTGAGFNVRVDQDEMLCLTLPGKNLNIYIRYVPVADAVPLMPFAFSGSELAGIVMASVLVGLLSLYISATTPKDWEENKQEEVQRVAQVVFEKPPTPEPPPEPKPVEPPPKVEEPPKPQPEPQQKKVVVADKTREEQIKGPKSESSQLKQVAARANEVAPKPNSQDRTKKFTSTRQGGAIKTAETAGANAQSSNKDLSKVGLYAAFGGGGTRANLDKAYSGAGDVIGAAERATGNAGFNENRAGNDFGSKFKDAGAGGKGTATQGIAGIGTKGRSSGQSAYGAADGFGRKTSVAIEGGGFEESFDGTIDKEAIRRVIRAKLHEVKGCYERVLNLQEKGQRLEGKVVLSWEIIEKGIARNVKIKSSTLGNVQVENCIRDRLASWTFPEPPTGMVAVVQAYPFVLNQTN